MNELLTSIEFDKELENPTLPKGLHRASLQTIKIVPFSTPVEHTNIYAAIYYAFIAMKLYYKQ